ncbi:MAG: hypothetical protein K2F71_06860, partial [Paramuribaculum sp.]|nr:hypothetical protein [Paramuribaculum sp.]
MALWVAAMAIAPARAASATLPAEPDSVSADDGLNAGRDSALTAAPDSTHALAGLAPTRPGHRLTASQRRRESLDGNSGDSSSFRPASGPVIVRRKVDIDNRVHGISTDSMVIIGQNNAFMYGNGDVTYGDIQITADQIEIDMQNNNVYAVGRPDSVGDIVGSPVFNDNGTNYEAKTMNYNFKTEQGYITDVITEQGEGYLTGGQTKKVGENVFYIQNGRYTTCSQHDDPHFWLQLTKAKVRPKKDIVSGPAYMVLAGLPLPLAI